MKKLNPAIVSVFPLLLLFIGCSGKGETLLDSAVRSASRTELSFDDDWLFMRGDIPGAEKPDFNDSGWKKLDLPHDWSIEDLPGKSTPFDSTAIGGLDAGYLVGGTGWYRKSFKVPSQLNGKHFLLQFDGIYMNAAVWLNGESLGEHPYGYTSFRYDITSKLIPGSTNTLSVRVRNEGHNSRWYSGSGIYRHVHISVYDPVHLDPWYLFISSPEVKKEHARLQISATVTNETNNDDEVVLLTRVFDKTGTQVASSETAAIQASGKDNISNEIAIDNPRLWSPSSPELYRIVNELFIVKAGNRVLTDSLSILYGIREVIITAGEGFVLNGEKIELKGGCMHHDNGPLGAAAFDRAEERRVQLMKESGFNAIRCAHNPPSPAFLDACDRIGMLVIDESFDMWRKPKNPDDYHLYFDKWWKNDVESMVRRDRNHPSVILWSIGNEIAESNNSEGAELAKEQADFVRSLDPSRMITSAANSLSPAKDPYFAVLDVSGYNYAVDKYVADHKRKPERIILSTESYALEAFEYWKAAEEYPWVIGDFVWTGFDYLGESSIGWLGYPHDKNFFPWNHAYCGDIDICGFKRPQSYYRDILWNNGDKIYLFVKPPVPTFPLNPEKAWWSKWEWHDAKASWNWQGFEGKNITVDVYSSLPEIELLLNGKSLGSKKNGPAGRFITEWSIPYEPGKLVARGTDENGKIVESELQTASPVTKILLKADRNEIKADGQDLCYINVELVDDNRVRNPDASNLINFEISGPGIIQATGSSDPRSTESFKSPFRSTYQGKCIVIVRAGEITGDIIIKAKSKDLPTTELRITALK